MTHYFSGDATEYTGKTKQLHGATAYECRIIEGARKGELVWTYVPPKENT